MTCTPPQLTVRFAELKMELRALNALDKCLTVELEPLVVTLIHKPCVRLTHTCTCIPQLGGIICWAPQPGYIYLWATGRILGVWAPASHTPVLCRAYDGGQEVPREGIRLVGNLGHLNSLHCVFIGKNSKLRNDSIAPSLFDMDDDDFDSEHPDKPSGKVRPTLQLVVRVAQGVLRRQGDRH